MEVRDRMFIKQYGEQAWCILRAYKKNGRIVITKQSDVLVFLQAKTKVSGARKFLRYWLKLLHF